MRRSLIGLSGLAALLFASESLGFVLTGTDWTWQASPVSEVFEFDVDSFPVNFGGGSTTDIENAYVASMDRWTFDAGADVVYAYGGLTTNNSWVNDNRNIGQYEAVAAGGTLAVAQSWIAGTDIIDCDIQFYGSNAFGAINWSVDPNGAGGGEYDFELTAVHELGHCLGLDHSGDSKAIMFGTQNSGTGPTDRDLHADDKAGAQAIYGANGTADLLLTGFTWDDLGDGDGILEPGESVAIVYYADNLATSDAIAVVTTTSSTDADVTVTTATGTPLLGPDIAGLSSDDIVGTVFEVDAACAANHDAWFEVSVVADNFTEEVYGLYIPLTCEAFALTTSDWTLGQAAWVEVTGANPGEEVKILRGTGGEGAGSCPAPLGGLCLDLLNPVVVQQSVTADAAGVARWDFVVPSTAAPNTDIWLQAVAVRGAGGVSSVKSNVEARTLLP